jgi:multiple sugar transport system substrate-binding protein
MTTRRAFLRNAVGVTAGAMALPALQACGAGGSGSSSDDLEVSWWGGSVRDKLTQKVLKLYEKKHPKENVTGQFASWSGYWQKMSTLAAGGSLPDVIQMDPSYIGEYTDRGQIMDLSKYKSMLELGDFDSGQLETGMVKGKLTGISLGGNIVAMLYNSSALQRAGTEPPPDSVDWDGYATYLSKLKKHLPSGMYPADDSSGFGDGLQVWARQHGEMFTPDGKLAVTKMVVHDWLQYWADLRKAKLIVPGAISAAATQIGTPDAEPIAKGQCVFTQSYSNFLGQYQVLVKDKIALARLPKGNKVGDYVEASMYFSVSAKASNAKEAVDFIKFCIHDPAAAKTLGVDRGVPGSAATRNGLKSSLKPYDAAQIDFLDKVGPLTRAKEVDPPSVGEVFDALTRASQAVSLGKASVDSATSTFMEQAQKALGS